VTPSTAASVYPSASPARRSCRHGIATMPQVASAHPNAPKRRRARTSSSHITVDAHIVAPNTNASSPTEPSRVGPPTPLLLPLIDPHATARPAKRTTSRLRPKTRRPVVPPPPAQREAPLQGQRQDHHPLPAHPHRRRRLRRPRRGLLLL
jgi:hypothetical protein